MTESAPPRTLEALREQVARQEQRIVELEVCLAFERQTAEALDSVVRSQAEALERLERRMSELVEDLRSQAELRRLGGTLDEPSGAGPA